MSPGLSTHVAMSTLLVTCCTSGSVVTRTQWLRDNMFVSGVLPPSVEQLVKFGVTSSMVTSTWLVPTAAGSNQFAGNAARSSPSFVTTWVNGWPAGGVLPTTCVTQDVWFLHAHPVWMCTLIGMVRPSGSGISSDVFLFFGFAFEIKTTSAKATFELPIQVLM